MPSTKIRPDLVIPDCPVVPEFLRQVRLGQERTDMTSLWVCAGQPSGLSPEDWADQHRDCPGEWLKIETSPDGAATAVGRTAALYALDLDERLEEANYLHYIKRYGHDQIAALVSEPTPLIAMLAICDMMVVYEDVSPATIAWALLQKLIQDTAKDEGLDEFTRETIVARVHRALRGDLQLPHPRDPFHW